MSKATTGYAAGQTVNVYALCSGASHDEYRFRFEAGNAVYMTRGNCWYGRVGGYDGGPWCTTPDERTRVLVVAVLAAHERTADEG